MEIYSLGVEQSSKYKLTMTTLSQNALKSKYFLRQKQETLYLIIQVQLVKSYVMCVQCELLVIFKAFSLVDLASYIVKNILCYKINVDKNMFLFLFQFICHNSFIV